MITLTAGQTEATVGMAAARTISPSPVFGLPANLCKRFCPQYGHKIVFKRKCYYGPQCAIPSLVGHANLLVLNHKLKTRAGKAGLDKRTVNTSPHPLRARSNNGLSASNSVPDSHNLPVLIHRMKTAETAAQRTTIVKTQNSPQILATLLPPRRPAPNLFKRFLAWAWSKSAFNDPAREMTSFGWRRRQ